MEVLSAPRGKRIMMENECNTLANAWDILCFRNVSVGNIEEENVWIVDTAADQCTVTRRAWHIDTLSHRYVGCNNYLNNNTTKRQIVSAYTVVEGPNLPPTLIRMHEGVLINDDNQTESLLHPYQAMSHQCAFNFTLTGYVDTNGNPGEPKLTVEDQIIPFQFDGRKLF